MSDARDGQPGDAGMLQARELVEVLLIGTETGYVCGHWDGMSVHVESTGCVQHVFPSAPGGSAETAARDLLAARSLLYELPAGSFLDVHSPYLDTGTRIVQDFFAEVRHRYHEVHVNGEALASE